jgi:hypothetical protein
MSAINEYPKFKHINEVPYINKLQIKLIYAKNFTPHKVEYYQKMVDDAINGISEISMKELLLNNGYKVNIGNHGLIFVTPCNGKNEFMKSFENIKEAYNYYLVVPYNQ